MRAAIRHAIALASLLLLPAAPALAEGADADTNVDAGATQAARLTEPRAETVARVEQYLSGIDTMHARFVQTASNGTTARGEVWVDRPGKLRFEYEPPANLLLVSNGTLLLYYDRELEQTSYVPISQTPLWFLVRERIDLARIDDYELAGIERGEKTLRLEIVQEGGQPGDPGSLTLVFEDDPLRLRKWHLVDQQGIETTVALLNPRFGLEVASKRFDFSKLDLPADSGVGRGR
jgi:outer membrane lipoprotein-sorting protein